MCGLEKFNLLFYGLQKCFLFRFHFKWLIIQHYFVCFALIVSLLSPKKNQVIFQLGYDFNLTLPLLLWSQDPHQSLPYNSSTKSSSAINHLSQVIKFLCACFLTLNLHFYDEEEMESNLFNLITQDVSIIISQILGVLFIYGLLSQVNQILILFLVTNKTPFDPPQALHRSWIVHRFTRSVSNDSSNIVHFSCTPKPYLTKFPFVIFNAHGEIESTRWPQTKCHCLLPHHCVQQQSKGKNEERNP